MVDLPALDYINGTTGRANKGLSALVNEDVFKLNRFEDPIGQAPVKPRGNLISWMKDIVSLIFRSNDNAGQEVDKPQVDSVNWVENGTAQLNRGIKNLKDRVRKKAFRYPWVVGISIMLTVGFLMIRLIKPTRKVLKVLK